MFKEVLADLGRGAVAVALDEPLVVVAVAEVLERLVQFVEAGEGADPEELFLERAPEALDAAVAFGGADEGGAGVHAEESDLFLEGAGDELAPVVVPELEAARDGFAHASEGMAAGLVERDHGFKAVGLDRRVDAQQLAGAMVVDAKDRGLLAARSMVLVASVSLI